MSHHLHKLTGCSPAPLANYLKALGILRLVAEQADAEARGWWQDECFCLLTRLSRKELELFFLNDYRPTPIISPWNKGSGFFKANDPGLSPIEQSSAPRFSEYRMGIADARKLLDSVALADSVIRAIKARTKTNKSFQTEEQRNILAESDTYRQTLDVIRGLQSKPELSESERSDVENELNTLRGIVARAERPATKTEAEQLKASAAYKRLLAAADRKFKKLKATLIPDCRKSWRGRHASWISAAVVLDEDGTPRWPSLLGTGGNDGNLDFTNNLMQIFCSLFDPESLEGQFRPKADKLLFNSLWLSPANQLEPNAIGQFQPGNAGGPNSSTGTTGDSLVNAWDFVLMMEGSILFSSRSTRRLDPDAASRASAPFAIRAHAAGFNSPGKEKSQRGEQWMPIWNRPSTLPEVAGLLGDGRLQLGRQTANRPVEAVRAISRLGVARGVDSFVRFGYLERNGQSTLAVPLGRISVRQHPHSHLIDNIASWMGRLERRSRDKHAPARLADGERLLADSVIAALTHDTSSERWQQVLRAAVSIEMMQASGTAIDVGPIPPLNPQWINVIGFDHSPEVRLAVALGSAAAGYSKGSRAIDPVRHHFLPLQRGARQFNTSDSRLVNDPRVVVSGRDPIADCAAIVQRRLIEAAAKGERRLPLVSAFGCAARLSDLALLLCGHVDLQQTLELARALMAIKWDKFDFKQLPIVPQPGFVAIPEAWLAIRMACLPMPLPSGQKIPVEPSMVNRLVSGDGCSATQIAIQRLRSAGIRPPLQAGFTDAATARLWAAALVFPLDRRAVSTCLHTLDPSQKEKSYV
ncbi:MAG: type I-U CRISPR-associated protein Csx17 [Pirellulaceae bacterium]|nr:type I-U CRISPR-associated protein Csx17 [Pirellulaceae bacterium]